MKALISKKSIIIASASMIIALITIISINLFNTSGPMTGFANTVTRPVRALASTVAEVFGNIFASIYRYDDLLERYDMLLGTVAEMQADFRDATELARENQQLRELLEFRERHAGFSQEMVSLVSWTSDNWSHTFEINRGYTNSDIRVGMPVATEYGALIGQVSEVQATRSIVITILDTTFSAGAVIGGDGSVEQADGTATVRGDFTQMRNGLLTLDHIDDDLIVLHGSDVFTSGAGGRFPVGLTVGQVQEVFTHASGIGRYATVRPARDIDTITLMFVITDWENPE